MDNPFQNIKKGAFTTTFKNRKSKYRHLKDLHQFSHYIVEHPEDFSKLTVKRARFYKNLIERTSGGNLPVWQFQEFIKNSYKLQKENVADYFLDKSISSREIQIWVDTYLKRVIVVFTGTYWSLDWLNNYQLIKGKYSQTQRFKRAKKVLDEALDKYKGYKFTMVSHSQSGMISHLLNSDKIFEVITYNPALLPLQKVKDNEYIVKTSADPVSVGVPKDAKTLIFNTGSMNPLYNHSPDALSKLKWNQLVGR
jgi:hypothetical protein